MSKTSKLITLSMIISMLTISSLIAFSLILNHTKEKEIQSLKDKNRELRTEYQEALVKNKESKTEMEQNNNQKLLLEQEYETLVNNHNEVLQQISKLESEVKSLSTKIEDLKKELK